MKTTKFFLMAALALTFAACSNDDNDILNPAQTAKGEGITITATLAPKSGSASTRKVTDGTDKIVAEWAVDEHIAILYNKDGAQMADAKITAVDGTTGVATIEFTVVDGTADNTACTLVYPAKLSDGTTTVYNDAKTGVKDAATLLASQDGTLSTNLDVRVGAGTIQITKPSLTVTTEPAAQFAIFKFTLSGPSIDGTHPLVIKDNGSGKTITTVTPDNTATSVYVAMPEAASKTYKFVVTTADNKYIKSGTAAITAGKYYETTLTMSPRYPLALASATVDELGSVIASDGNIYLKNAATPSGNTGVAMIAYVSGSNGLAIALADDGSRDWNSAKSTCENKSKIGGKSWKLPTMDEWKQMFSAFGGNENSYTGLNTAITTAGGTALNGKYWSSSEGGDWDEDDGYNEANFVELYNGDTFWSPELKNESRLVRAVLAF